MLAGTRTATLERRLVAIPTTAGWPRPAAVLALARTETRKLLLHPAFLAGFSLFLLLVRLLVGGRSGGGSTSLAIVVGGLAIGLLAGTLLAANACALRARRDRMGELFGSLAAPPETRTAAMLLAVLAGPVSLAILLAIAAYPVMHAEADLRLHFGILVLAQFPLTAAAFGALGIALARWIPHPATAAVTLVAQVMGGIIWLVPWIASEHDGIRMGWHYTYLLSGIAFWASLALARDRRRPWVVAVTGVALVLMITGALFQVPPGGLA
jgi:hypothetical protein